MADVKITVRMNGPYRVEAPEGAIELVDANGNAFDLSTKLKEGKLAFSLCRCGGSVTNRFATALTPRLGSKVLSWR